MSLDNFVPSGSYANDTPKIKKLIKKYEKMNRKQCLPILMKTLRRLNKRKPHKYKKTVKFGGKPWAREGNRWVKSFAIPPPVPPKMNEPVN